MVKQGQVFHLASRNGEASWAYRYRVGGRGSRPLLHKCSTTTRSIGGRLHRYEFATVAY